MKNDYKLIFESYSKHVLEADGTTVQAGNVNVNAPNSIQPQPQPQAQQPVQQPSQPQQQAAKQPEKEESVTNQELTEISKYINSAYEAQIKLLDILLQRGILDNNSKNDLQSAAFGSLASLSRELVYSAAQNDSQKINSLRNSFHKDIAGVIQPLATTQQSSQQQSAEK